MVRTEFPDAELEGHKGAVRQKKWVRSRIRRLANELAAEGPRKHVDPVVLADHLSLLFEGVYATVPALGAGGPANVLASWRRRWSSTAPGRDSRLRFGSAAS
jgi:hypothetical protein